MNALVKCFGSLIMVPIKKLLITITKCGTWNGNKMLAVIAKFETSDELRMTEHGCHAFARDVIVDGQGLVRAWRGRVHPAPVQGYLDQGAVLAGRALEGARVFAVGNRVDSDVPILACCQDMFVIVL